MKNRLAAFFMQKKEVSCMGYARKDVEKTKKIAKKFVRYQEGAESGGKVNHRDVQTGDMYILI